MYFHGYIDSWYRYKISCACITLLFNFTLVFVGTFDEKETKQTCIDVVSINRLMEIKQMIWSSKVCSLSDLHCYHCSSGKKKLVSFDAFFDIFAFFSFFSETISCLFSNEYPDSITFRGALSCFHGVTNNLVYCLLTNSNA